MLTRPSQSLWRSGRGVFLLLVAWVFVTVGATYIRDRGQRPDRRQKIAATLVSWGLSADGVAPAVSDEEVHRHVALLGSPVSEERVRAAWWLADHGVREAGPAIAVAMDDPGTLRPCQLAHNLGRLGDERWVGDLIVATTDAGNGDLQVCATDALGELASPKSIDALVEVYRGGFAATSALYALGKIADPSTRSFLESVARSPRDEHERRAAEGALQRVSIMSLDDPVPTLLERVKQSHGSRGLDAWPLRKLAGIQDRRAVLVLANVLRQAEDRSESDRVLLAATLLAHGGEGATALESMIAGAPSRSSDVAAVARDALALLDNLPTGPGVVVAGGREPAAPVRDEALKTALPPRAAKGE